MEPLAHGFAAVLCSLSGMFRPFRRRAQDSTRPACMFGTPCQRLCCVTQAHADLQNPFVASVIRAQSSCLDAYQAIAYTMRDQCWIAL